MSDKKYPADTTKAVNDTILALGFALDSKEAVQIWRLVSIGYSDGAIHATKSTINDSQ